MGRTVRLDANVSAIIKASTPLRGRFRFSDRYAMMQRAQIEADRDRTYTRGLAALDAYGVATGAQADATTALSAAGVAQAAAEAAQTDATGALTLAGSKTRVVYSNSPPGTGFVTGDLWFNTDTSTDCPDNNCKGHVVDASGDPLVGAHEHRIAYWAHRYNGSAWVDANRAGFLVASEIAAGAIVADKIAAGAISADKMAASAIITSDYHETTSTVYPEGTSGTWADTGAKMFNNTTGGTPIRVSPQGLRVGRWRLDEPIVRATTTLASDGSGATGRAWYRGSNTGTQPYLGSADGTTSRITVTRRKWDTTNKIGRFDVVIQPEDDSDNLDGLRTLLVKWYRHATEGSGAQGDVSVDIATTYHPLPDRRYKTPGTDGDGGNAIYLSLFLVDTGIAFLYPCLMLQVFGVAGESEGRCFYSNTGSGNDVALACSGSAWPTAWSSNAPGSPPSGGSGGGSGGGGACPAPETKVRMADGSFKEAGALVPGDKVYTAHETTLAWGVYTVSFAQVEEPAARVRMVLDDDRELVCSPGHRVLTEAGWRQVATLPPGVTVKGATSGVVRSVEPWPAGPVVKLVVDGASTWLSHDGILNHNMKIVE